VEILGQVLLLSDPWHFIKHSFPLLITQTFIRSVPDYARQDAGQGGCRFQMHWRVLVDSINWEQTAGVWILSLPPLTSVPSSVSICMHSPCMMQTTQDWKNRGRIVSVLNMYRLLSCHHSLNSALSQLLAHLRWIGNLEVDQSLWENAYRGYIQTLHHFNIMNFPQILAFMEAATNPPQTVKDNCTYIIGFG
jgi:hypothetical protein